MSHWWSDQLRIHITPQHVALLRLAGGRLSKISEKRIVQSSVTDGSDNTWRNSIKSITSLLPEISKRKADVVVLLSNHFVHYTVVQPGDTLITDDEREALVRYNLARVYGPVTDQWAIRLSDRDQNNREIIACAIEREFQDSLQSLFKATPLRLRSIQPYLMSAFNLWRHHFKESAWFALAEPGALCIAKFKHGHWRSIKCTKVGEDWFGEMVTQLAREKIMTEEFSAEMAVETPIYLFAPGMATPDQHLLDEHSLELLHAPTPRGIEADDAPYVMAMAG